MAGKYRLAGCHILGYTLQTVSLLFIPQPQNQLIQTCFNQTNSNAFYIGGLTSDSGQWSSGIAVLFPDLALLCLLPRSLRGLSGGETSL